MHRRTTDLVRPLCSFLLIVAFAFALAAPTLAENVATLDGRSGSIAGTVTDPNGDTVPGATVILQGPESSDRYTTLANENGYFEVHDVRSGVPYRVTIHADGFADWTSPSIVLKPSQYKILTGCKLRLEGVQTSVNVGYSSVEVATNRSPWKKSSASWASFPIFMLVTIAIPRRSPQNSSSSLL